MMCVVHTGQLPGKWNRKSCFILRAAASMTSQLSASSHAAFSTKWSIDCRTGNSPNTCISRSKPSCRKNLLRRTRGSAVPCANRNRKRRHSCAKSEARIAALLRILAGCAARGGSIPAVVFDRRATKHPAKIRAALRVGAAPAPRRVPGSLNRSSAIRLASEGGEAKAGAFAYAPCARACSEKQQEEAWRRAAPDARERIPTGAGAGTAKAGAFAYNGLETELNLKTY